MKKKGFTLIEVSIAVAIFSLMLIYVIKLNNTTNSVANSAERKLQLLDIAKSQVEEYKNGFDLNYLPQNPYIKAVNGGQFYVKISVSDVQNGVSKQLTVTAAKRKDDLTGSGSTDTVTLTDYVLTR